MGSKMPAAAVVDDDLQQLINDVMNSGPEEEADDRETEQLLTTIASVATEYLDNADPSPEQVQWASDTEASAQKVADTMASCVADLRRGLAVFAGTGTPEEAAFARHAAWASLARRLLEKHIRCLAARDIDQVVVNPEMAELTTTVCEAMESESDLVNVPTPEEVEGRAAVVVLRMAVLKYKLTWGADGFEGRDGEEAVVKVLRERAAAAEKELEKAIAFDATICRYRAWFVEAAEAAASPVHKRASPEMEEEEDPAGPRQRRRTSLAGETGNSTAVAQDELAS